MLLETPNVGFLAGKGKGMIETQIEKVHKEGSR